MTTFTRRLKSFAVIVIGCTLVGNLSAEAQISAPPAGAAPAPAARQPSKAEIDAEREKIWNSSDMLRARAWLQDYCSKSAKVTPEEAKDYQQELANMSPKQMKLWLMKFDEEEQVRQQQYAAFQHSNSAGLQQAAAFHQQVKQQYAAANQAENQSAQVAQQKITEQQQNAQSNEENKQLDQVPPPTAPYGFYGGYGPYPAVQYHYHLY